METITFEDVAINFTREEWTWLKLPQKKLYIDVMLETLSYLASIGKKQENQNTEDNYRNPGEDISTQFSERLYEHEVSSQCDKAYQQNVKHTMNEKTLSSVAPFKNSVFGETILAQSPVGMPFKAHTNHISLQYQEYVGSPSTHKESGRACRKFLQGNIGYKMHTVENNPLAAKQYGNSDSYCRFIHIQEDMDTLVKQRCECLHCRMSFLISSTPQVHNRIYPGERPYGCKQCGKTFPFYSNLRRHESIHTGEKPYVCEQCGKCFRSSFNLTSHRKTHSGEKPFRCQLCEKAFIDSRDLKVHERTHTGEKPYTCKHCGKTFAYSRHCKVHERTHTGEKPYMCKQCGKTFTSSDYLKAHERSHNKENLYRCKQCGKTVTSSSYLKAHERTHTGERPYGCKQCGKTFTFSSALRVHERIHTGERPYECKQCGKTFTVSFVLRRHENTHARQKL